MSEPHPRSIDTHRMMICPGCEKEIKVLNEFLGLKIECTICGKRFKARILDDEKRRLQRAERAKAAQKAAEDKEAARKAVEALQAAASRRHRRRAANSDNNILERAAHGDLRGHVVPAEGVEDLLDSPEMHAPEPTPETKGERDFHLITIRGKPLWIGVTLAVMALSVVSYLATRPDRDSSTGVASLPPTPNRPAPATRTIGSSDIKEPLAEAEPYRGLGFSLADIEEGWGIDRGWYWREKNQDTSGIGIRYVAGNVNIPGVMYVVTGLPENVRTFRVTFSTPLDRWELEDFGRLLAAQAAMVSMLTGCSTEDLLKWITSILKVFADGKIFGSDSDVRTCGEFLLTATVTVSMEREIGVTLTVEPNIGE